MYTKLTLRIDSELIEHAKLYSQKTEKSVSQIVADYFAMLDEWSASKMEELPPITQSLQGVLRESKLSKKDYQKYLEDKYK